MGDIVQLRSPIDLDTELGRAFIVDATRAGEGLISDKELQEKYEISDAEFRLIAKDKAIGRAIRSESEFRVRNGLAAREAAAKHFVKAPAVLDGIMSDANSNPRHKIEAIKELRVTATGGGGDHPAAAGEKFTIIINLGADTVERFEFDHTPKPQVDLERNDNGDQWG
jgi:shikimate kinase